MLLHEVRDLKVVEHSSETLTFELCTEPEGASLDFEFFWGGGLADRLRSQRTAVFSQEIRLADPQF
jgi:hypothetical protein